MRANLFSTLTTTLVVLSIFGIALSGCGGSYEDTISGVKVPVPKAMEKDSEKPAEMSFLGFGAGQASFHGKMDPDKIVEFYKKELAARGWQPNMNMQSGGAMLAYSKEGKTLLIAVGNSNDSATLTLTVGGMGK
ncbi:MAG: hypothetical protein ACREQO_19950 [Candidatus Binatia bacterium]